MSSKTILVTGSNTGIGFEVVRVLTQKGHNVYLCSRNEAAGKELSEAKLREESLHVKFVQLDVTDKASIIRAKDTVEKAEGKLDILVNNAGVAGWEYSQDPYEMSEDLIDFVFKANFSGVVMTTTIFLPLLRKSSELIITNVSSELGSNTYLSDPKKYLQAPMYSASKAAVNSYTDGFKVNSVTPGHIPTKLSAYHGYRTIPQGAEAIIRWVLLEKDGPTGHFGSCEGCEHPW
ncbi:hypothetical protein BDQ17DRAFT_1368254 [Cyathus striatus]|nr:hypothetical protein BDQ17DRAFT_1368254 [Cyathus striatus]